MGYDRRKKLLWVTFLYVDMELHKTSRIEILRHLANRGYDVTMLAAYSTNRPSYDEHGIRIISIPVRKVPLISYLVLATSLVFLLPILILKIRPNFVIAESELGTFLGLISARAISKPLRPTIVMDVRSTPVEARGLQGQLENLSFRIAIVIAKGLLDGITTITTMMKRDICANFHINPKSVGIWTSGVSTKIFAPDTVTAKELRAEMKLEGKFVVLYHGVLTANRGVGEAMDSIRLLEGKYHDIVLLVLGKGPALSSLRTTHRKEIAEGRVIFHGPVKYQDVRRYISACDIGIVPLPDIPDWRSQCPLNLLECLAMGKVVVATDIPANREVASESKAVVYAASSNPKDIAKAIMYAFDNRSRLDEWGIDGRAIMEKKYDWTIIARDLDRYLSSRC